MSENQQNHNNGGDSNLSNGHVDNIQERMMRMRIESEIKDDEPTEIYPVRPGEPDCIYYSKHRRCGYGANCRYNHPPLPAQTDESKSEPLPQREGQSDCGHFLKTGTCKYGPTCKYHHPLDRRGAEVISYNSLGLPFRNDQIDCPYYGRHWTCKFGAACKFNHPEPTSLETASPLSEAAAVGIGSSVPSTGIPFVGAYQPAWPWPSSSCFSGPQAYMPYLIPAFQGPVPHNWNGYLGNMSSMGASNVMGADLIYTSKNPSELVSGGQGDWSTMTASNLPERPDQPRCRYFNEPSGCKFGSSCKFLHPREKMVHTLGPHGLPLRPGEDICSEFSLYGVCRLGPTCKYNHPFPGHLSGYYLGMPPMILPNQPFFPPPTQRNFPASSSTDTSQSKSLKITEWIQKPETVGDKNRQHSPTKPVENGQEKVEGQSKDDSHGKVDDQSNVCTTDSHEKVDDQSNAANVTNGEIPREQSD